MTTTTGSRLEHAIGAEGLLAIRLRDGEVRLHGIDGDIVRVRDANGNELADMFTIDAATGSLSLRAGRGLEIIVGPRARRRHERHSPELEVDVPRRATLVIEAASGDVEADGLVGDQRYRTASGDVVLRSVAGRLSVEVVSGDIELTANGEADVAARTVSGDVAIRAATLSGLQVNTTSGDMKIAGRLAGPGPFTVETVSGDGLLAPAGDIRIEMTSLAGDLTSDLDGKQVSERGRRSLIIGTSGPVVAFRSMSGDLHVARPTLVASEDSAKQGGLAQTPTTVSEGTPDPGATWATSAPANGAIAAAYDEARLRILRSLERGEIDVAEAGRRLETLDAGDVDASAHGDAHADG
jgi:hypothetical protein